MILAVTGVNGNLGGKLVGCLAPGLHASLLRCARRRLRGGRSRQLRGLVGAALRRHRYGTALRGRAPPTASWAQVQHGNILATGNVLRVARRYGVRRIIFASTNQVMGGYRFSDELLTTRHAARPLNPYAVSKLFCEETGRAFSSETGISFIAFRIGNIQAGENIPHAGMGLGLWGQQMWLSNRDFIGGVRAAIVAPEVPFAILNLVSNNPGMPLGLDTHVQGDRVSPSGWACS